jgi:hypothetical protein
VINTPLILGENAPSSSRQGTHAVHPLDFMIELVLHNSFSWVFWSYRLKFDISLWTSLLNTSNLARFFVASFKSTNMNEMISKQTLTFGIHFAITSTIGEENLSIGIDYVHI